MLSAGKAKASLDHFKNTVLNSTYVLPSLGTSVFLFFAALVAGAMNAVAGGGTFITFPALLFTHLPAIPANATNTAAVWPGSVASSVAYRKVLTPETWRILWPLVIMCFVGALLGAHILLHTPPETFVKLIPWLLLCATLIFATSGKITSWIQSRKNGDMRSWLWIAGGFALQLVIAMYVGYFGAGAGILVLALLALMGQKNIHTMNGMKTVIVSVANAVALVTFIVAKIVIWPQALIMIAGSLIGGYGGAHIAQRMKQIYVRRAVIAIGLAMSIYFFARY
jgi:hypothetical protein